MDPVYCINLVSSAARRRRMERRFAWHGLTDHVTFAEALGPGDADVSRIVVGVNRPDLAALGCAAVAGCGRCDASSTSRVTATSGEG